MERTPQPSLACANRFAAARARAAARNFFLEAVAAGNCGVITGNGGEEVDINIKEEAEEESREESKGREREAFGR